MAPKRSRKLFPSRSEKRGAYLLVEDKIQALFSLPDKAASSSSVCGAAIAGPVISPAVPGVHELVLNDNSSLYGEVMAPTLKRRSKPTGKLPHSSRRELLRPNDANLF